MSTPILLAALLFPLQTAKAEATVWETVVSEDGQYSVEMPATPNVRGNRSRSAPDGEVRMSIRGCRAAGGNYFVQKSEFATNLIRGTDDSQLDAERDEFARQYGGTPTGEKKVTLGGIPGREFTVRGKPKGELGIITVRVREYLVGKKIFAILVTSIANRELPDDTDRFLGSLKLLSGVAVKPTPAPSWSRKARCGRGRPRLPRAPAPGGPGLEGWGTPVDPDGDCKIHPEGNTLVIDLPNNRPITCTPFSARPTRLASSVRSRATSRCKSRSRGHSSPRAGRTSQGSPPTAPASSSLKRGSNFIPRSDGVHSQGHLTSWSSRRRWREPGPGQSPDSATGRSTFAWPARGTVLASVSSDGKKWERRSEPVQSICPTV